MNGVLLDFRARPSRWSAIARDAGRIRARADRALDRGHGVGLPIARLSAEWTATYDLADVREAAARFLARWAPWWRT